MSTISTTAGKIGAFAMCTLVALPVAVQGCDDADGPDMRCDAPGQATAYMTVQSSAASFSDTVILNTTTGETHPVTLSNDSKIIIEDKR